VHVICPLRNLGVYSPRRVPRVSTSVGNANCASGFTLGISSLVLTLITGIRGLPNVRRSVIWIAVILAAIPWVATPTIMIPIQERLAAAGPASGLIKQLLWRDILLRSLPPVIQSIILLGAVLRSVRRS